MGPWRMLAFTLSSDCLRGTGSPRHCVDMDGTHISTHDTERYYLGIMTPQQVLLWAKELSGAGCLRRRLPERDAGIQTLRRIIALPVAVAHS